MSFKRLDPEDFLISADSITAGAWTSNASYINNFFYFLYSKKEDQLVEIIT